MSDFQSQLGSIGACQYRRNSSKRTSFQSQLGSIGAFSSRTTSHALHPLSIPAWFDWRAEANTDVANARSAFNPSLVRLAPYRLLHAAQTGPDFQSQLGSIGALNMLKDPSQPVSLSIPAWFDWRPRLAEAVREALSDFQSQLGSIGAVSGRRHGLLWAAFQSQLGSIGAQAVWTGLTSHKALSIPAWFDWRPVGSSGGAKVDIPFNPSLVRLALVSCSAARFYTSSLSIPAWFDWRRQSGSAV